MAFDIKCEVKSDFTFQFRDFNHINLNRLHQAITNAQWGRIYELNDIEDCVEFFTSEILTIYNNHVALKTAKLKHPDTPWLTEEITTTFTLRDIAYNAFKRNNSSVNWEFFRALRNRATILVRRAKKQYYDQFLERNLDSKKLWNRLRAAGVTQAKKAQQSLNQVNPNETNQYFANMCCAKNVILPLRDSNSNFDCHYAFYFRNVDQAEVTKAIMSIKSNATGADQFHPRFVKLILSHIIIYLTHIFNQCLTKSVFPTKWKIATIIPLLKTSTYSSLNDLRPISILPFFPK